MAMTGKFGADFAEFYDEAAKSARALAMMAAGAEGVDTSIGTMAATMEGAATTVSASVVQMGTTSTKTSTSFAGMAQQIQVADKTLSAFGVNVRPVTNVLTEMGGIAGQTTTSLGLLGTASTVAATALAAWNLGRWIAELTGADAAISNLTASMLGWGDLAAEEFASKQDVLMLATIRSGRVINDMDEALRENAKWLKANYEQYNTGEQRVKGWQDAISKVARSGLLAELNAEIKAGNSTLAEMASHYEIDARAIEWWTRSKKAQAAAFKEAREPLRQAADDAKQHAEAIGKLTERMLGGGLITAAKDYAAALGPMSNLSKMTTDETTKLNATMLAAIDAYTRAGTVAPQAIRDIYVATTSLGPVTVGLGSAWNSLGETIQVNAEKILETARAVQSQEEINQAYYKQLDAEIDAAYKSAQEGAKAATGATQETTGAVNALANAYANVAQSAAQYKQLAAGLEFDAAYNTRQGGTAASIAMGQRQAASGFRLQAGILEQREAFMGSATAGVPWGRQGSVSTVTNVGLTVNAAGDGQAISAAVLDGMRRQGVRLGS